MRHYQPDKVYNIAAQSVPGDSWSHPLYTGEITALGVVRVMEAVRVHAPQARIYQAISREIFGNVQAESVTEQTPFDANNPYGIAKAYAHMMTHCYRESYGLFAYGSILFNHESPRHSLHFVTHKVTAAVACIKNQVAHPPLDELGRPLVTPDGTLKLGYLDARRDWGYAKEYVEAMWLMLQNETPKDYVIGTNTSYSVRDLCETAFAAAGLDWQEHVAADEALLRPTEMTVLKGDYTQAKQDWGWQPLTSFAELVQLMVEADLALFRG
ncbi:MAG: GDP-mannose 4,6-dehydratase [Chloroflexota bacterium]|nr:MAG: GDP-mannose 4,6-dehydratase [Chloroflexota bacterium]